MNDRLEISALLSPSLLPASSGGSGAGELFPFGIHRRQGELSAVIWRGCIVKIKADDVDDVVHPSKRAGGEGIWTTDADRTLCRCHIHIVWTFRPITTTATSSNPALLVSQIPNADFLIITFANALEGTNGIVTKVELVDARAVAGCVVKAGPYGIFILFEAGWLEGPDVNVLHKPKNSSLDSIIIRVELRVQ